jgi:hypothetical protein
MARRRAEASRSGWIISCVSAGVCVPSPSSMPTPSERSRLPYGQTLSSSKTVRSSRAGSGATSGPASLRRCAAHLPVGADLDAVRRNAQRNKGRPPQPGGRSWAARFDAATPPFPYFNPGTSLTGPYPPAAITEDDPPFPHWPPQGAIAATATRGGPSTRRAKPAPRRWPVAVHSRRYACLSAVETDVNRPLALML